MTSRLSIENAFDALDPKMQLDVVRRMYSELHMQAPDPSRQRGPGVEVAYGFIKNCTNCNSVNTTPLINDGGSVATCMDCGKSDVGQTLVGRTAHVVVCYQTRMGL